MSLLAMAIAPSSAAAHEPQVFDPGPVELDLGRPLRARLLHVTLVGPQQELVVHLAGDGARVQLLVPDREPERSAAAVDLPRMRIGPGLIDAGEPVRVVDEVTGVAYRRIAATTVGGDTIVRVKRGAQSTRAALLVAATDETFATNDPRRIPRTLLHLRQWAETPATGSPTAARQRAGRGGTPPSPYVAWFGAGIALAALLVTTWWVRRGRSSARRRGVERLGRHADD